MSKYAIKNVEGAQVAETELADSVFGIEPNISCIHQVVVCQDACKRQGTHSTKNRHDVSGGGAKPYRQKGTGRARQGTIRAPHWVGGGVVFGPHTRSYEMKVNRKEVKLAMRSALSAKLADGELVIVKDFGFEKPCTKDAVAALKALGLEGKRITLVIGNEDVETFLSFRNIHEVNIVPVGDINTYELIDNKALVIVDTCLNRIEEVLA